MDGFLLTAESGIGSPSGDIVGWQTDGDGDLQDLEAESPQAKMNLFKGKKLRSRGGPDSQGGAIVPVRVGSGSHNRSVSRESSKKSIGREGSIDSLASSSSGMKKISSPKAQLPGRAPWSSGAPTAEEGFGGMVEGRSASPTLMINVDEANNIIAKLPKDGRGGPITPLPPADDREGAEDGAAVEAGLDQAAVVVDAHGVDQGIGGGSSRAKGGESGEDGVGAGEGAGTADDQGMAAADPVVVYEFASDSNLEAAIAARIAGKGSQNKVKVNHDPSWVDVRDSSFRSDVTFSHYSPKRGRATKLPLREASLKDANEKSTQQTRPVRCVSPWHPSLDPGPDLSLITAPSRASPGSIGPAHGFNDRAPGLPSTSIRRMSIESLGDYLNPRVPLSSLGARVSGAHDRDVGGDGIETFDQIGGGGDDDGGPGAWSPMPHRAGRTNSLSRSLSSLSFRGSGGGGGGAVSRVGSRPTTHDLSVAGVSRPMTSPGDVSGGREGQGEEGGNGVGGGDAGGGVSQSISFEDLDLDFQVQAQSANLSSTMPSNSRLNTPMTQGTYLPPASALAPGASGPVAAALRALAEKKKIKSFSKEPRPRTMQRPPGELLTAGTSIGVGGVPPRVYSPSLKRRAAAQEEERARARDAAAAALAARRKWREQDEEGEGKRRTAGKWAGGRVRLVGDNNSQARSSLSRWESSSTMWSPQNPDAREIVIKTPLLKDRPEGSGKQGGGNADPSLEMSFTFWSPMNMANSGVQGGSRVGDETRISTRIIKGLGSSGTSRESAVAVGGLVGGSKGEEEGGGEGAVAQEENVNLQAKEKSRRVNVEVEEEQIGKMEGRSGGKGERGDRDRAGKISGDAARARGTREEDLRGETSDASSGSFRGVGRGLERGGGGKLGSTEAGEDQQTRGAQSIANRRSAPVSRVQTAPAASTLSTLSGSFIAKPGFGLERGKPRDLGGVSSPGAKPALASPSRKSPIPVKLRGVAALEEPFWWQIEGFDPMSELGAEGLGWGGQQGASERRKATLRLQRSLDTVHKVNVRFLDLPMDQHANVPLP